MQTLVLVTGQPGVGKSTLARELAPQLQIPLLEKDAIKDVLLEQLGAPDRQASRRLSAAAFELMYAMARTMHAATLEGNFDPALARNPILALHPTPIEVFCRCEPSVALARYRARDRHPGHFDTEMLPEIERRLRSQQRALALGPVLEVDTGDRVDIEQVAAWVRTRR